MKIFKKSSNFQSIKTMVAILDEMSVDTIRLKNNQGVLREMTEAKGCPNH
jgi:hypothetical protein